MNPRLQKLWHKHRPALRHFGIRLAISALILGSAYILIFGLPIRKNGPTTPAGKLAAIRANAASLNLTIQSLARFTKTDPTAYSELTNANQTTVSQANDLSNSLKRAPKNLTQSERKQIQQLLDDARLSAKGFSPVTNVFDKILQYDPSNDLALAISDPNLSIRANAANAGIAAAIGGTPKSSSLSAHASNDSLVSPESKQLIGASATCFGTLHSQLDAKQYTEATKTKQSCITTYPAVRRQAISDILKNSYSKDYAARSQQQTDQLMRAIDKTSSE